MITSEILQKTCQIEYGNTTGTCFVVSIENKDYLITARHLFPDALKSKAQISVEVFNNKGPNFLACKLLLHSNPNIDIAVLDLMTSKQKENAFDLNSAKMQLSQECYFLGFPFGLKMDDKKGNLNHGFPIPFVKKGIISSFMYDPILGSQIFLDGHNNLGFSGGPVVIINKEKDEYSQHRLKIIGVVATYIGETKTINTPIGDFEINENTGIIECYDIQHVYEILTENK